MQPLAYSVALLCASFVLTALALRFRDLAVEWEPLTVRPLLTGAAAGLAFALVSRYGAYQFLVQAIGPLFTVAALHVGRNSTTGEPVDSIATGTMIAIGAALPLLASTDLTLVTTAALLLAAPVAVVLLVHSYRHAQPARIALQFAALAGSSAAAFIPGSIERLGIRDLQVAIAVCLIAPISIAATVLQRWRMLVGELTDEARLGLYPADQIARVAHPYRRFSRGGWLEKAAARQFVRVSTRLALRKHQQRSMDTGTARLYQLEILKLRMELNAILDVERSYAANASRGQEEFRNDAASASDTMPTKGLKG